MDTKQTANLEKLQRLVSNFDHTQPFLYYLPFLLAKRELASIKPEQTIRFVELALKQYPPLIVKDALNVLNKTIDPEDGSFREASRSMFYENQSFFWGDLGRNTNTVDIILHVFNKMYFEIMVGQHT